MPVRTWLRPPMHPTGKYYQGKKTPGKKKEKVPREILAKKGITAKKKR